jgi:hypothetical protein
MSVGTRPPPGWWFASDGRWYPPERHPGRQAVLPLSQPVGARETRFRLVSGALAIGILAAAVGLGVIAASGSPASTLGGESANQVLAVALQAATEQGSVEVSQQVSAFGALKLSTTFDLNLTTGRQILSGGPIGTATLLQVPGVAYLKADAKFLTRSLDFSPRQADTLANRWIAFRPGDTGYQQITQDDTLASLLHDIAPTGRLTLGSPTTVNGMSAVGVSGGPSADQVSGSHTTGREVLYVSTSSPNLPVEISVHANEDGIIGASSTLHFAQWGEPVSVVAPTNAVPAGGPSTLS